MPAAIKVNLRRSFSRVALSLRPFALIRPSGDAKSEIRISFDATLRDVGGGEGEGG